MTGIDATSQHELQQALRSTTETLASELARSSQGPPRWSDLQWCTARAVASIHGISALLATRLRWSGPSEWNRFLRTQQQHTQSRYGRIQRLLAELDASLRRAAIPAVALKGAELYARGIYSPGVRPMADIDLLVRNVDSERSAELLHSLGFRHSHTCWKHQTFVPQTERAPALLGEHGDNDLKIELHERVAEKLPLERTDITDIVFPASARPGLNPYPSQAALMIHLLLHAAGSMPFRSLRMLHLHDLALLGATMTESDWTELMIAAAGGPGLWWTLPPLCLTDRYYPGVIPDCILGMLAAGSRWPLRRACRHYELSDVSLSRLHIEAFPGIEWAQSLTETVEYVLRRLRPDSEMLEVREGVASHEAWAAASPWCQMPQHRRILRWLTSRPARPATLHAVRAALETDG
jgi:hypothetical protein